MRQSRALALLLTIAWSASAHPTHGNQPAKTYERCQRTGKQHPLDDCPPNTIYVTKSNNCAGFSTIQSAILSIPNNTVPYIILIAPGSYHEQLNVTRQGPLTLLGVSDRPWKGQLYADIETETTNKNLVTVWHDAGNPDGSGKIEDNVETGVLTVGPTFNATLTGSGPTGAPVPPGTPFGCSDFRAYNIDFRNNAVNQGPDHAVGVSRANAGFYSCGLFGSQDTLYVGKVGSVFFHDSVIAGAVDFIYGFGTVWFEKCSLAIRGCGGGVTAWKGTNTTFENKYGAYISNSRVLAANVTVAEAVKGTCALGRPWNSLHRSIFMDTHLDASIMPAGYMIWGASTPNFGSQTLMATYNDFGPGYDKRAEQDSNVTVVLSSRGVRPYSSPVRVFQTEDGEFGDVRWIDQSVYPRE